LEFLAAVPTAIIPFEAGGQQFSEFPHHDISSSLTDDVQLGNVTVD